MPGSTPATSQLDWLSSTTAMIVLSWSKATRDLLKSFSWGIGALRQLFASDDGAISFAACPIPSLWRTKKSRWTGAATVICGLAIVGAWSIPVPSRAQETNATQAVGETTVLSPDPLSALSTPAVGLSAEQRELLLTRKRQLQKDNAATTQNNPP